LKKAKKLPPPPPPRPWQPKKQTLKKPTRVVVHRVRGFAVALTAAASFVGTFGSSARALPPPAAPTPLPRSAGSATPEPAFTGAVLPYGSPILFVLDDKINSGSTAPGTTIHMHLKSPLVVGGQVLASAGAPATFTVVTTAKAQTGDVDGAIQIHLEPFALPGRNVLLPVRAYHEYLTIEMTAGQLATRGTTDDIADVFVPYHSLYHALRKGHQMVLPAGSILRAETDATIDASKPGSLTIATPPPFVSTFDAPHADLTAAPFYTPAPMRPHPLPKGKPTLPPREASPSPVPTSTPTQAPFVPGTPAPVVSGVPTSAASDTPVPFVPGTPAPIVSAAPTAAASPR
jgi:hypothetical protein